MTTSRDYGYDDTISGLLRKRAEFFGEPDLLGDHIADIRNDIEALDRTLGALGHVRDLDAAMPRQKREVVTFTFLGFTFICSKSRQGRFQVRRKSRGDRMKATLKAVKDGLRRRMHRPIPIQGRWLKQVVTGYFNYPAVPTNSGALAAFRAHVLDLWRRTFRRRSQKGVRRSRVRARPRCSLSEGLCRRAADHL